MGIDGNTRDKKNTSRIFNQFPSKMFTDSKCRKYSTLSTRSYIHALIDKRKALIVIRIKELNYLRIGEDLIIHLDDTNIHLDSFDVPH